VLKMCASGKEELSQQQWERLLKRADVDGNGRLNYDEFVRLTFYITDKHTVSVTREDSCLLRNLTK